MRKGFKDDASIESLQKASTSLVRAILALFHVLPRKPHVLSRDSAIPTANSVGQLSSAELARVRDLHATAVTSYSAFEYEKPSGNDAVIDLIDQDTLDETTQALETLNNQQQSLGQDGPASTLARGASGDHDCPDQERDEYEEAFSGLFDPKDHKIAGVTFQVPQMSGSLQDPDTAKTPSAQSKERQRREVTWDTKFLQYRFHDGATARKYWQEHASVSGYAVRNPHERAAQAGTGQRELTFANMRVPIRPGTSVTGTVLKIFPEFAAAGCRHPNAFASAAGDNDAAQCLALRMVGLDQSGAEETWYAENASGVVVGAANAFTRCLLEGIDIPQAKLKRKLQSST